MLIIKMQGGLGNQLYQYALYEKMKMLGKEVKLDMTDYTAQAKFRDKRDFELGLFQSLSYEICSQKERKQFVDDKMTFLPRLKRKILGDKTRILEEEQDYMPEILKLEEGYLSGFWQCEKYYEDMMLELQKRIRFSTAYNKKTQQLLKQLEQDYKKESTVSIHVRLSDYVEKPSTYGGICTKEYYQSAIDYIKNHVSCPKFYLFSDEPEKASKMMETMDVDFEIVDFNIGKESGYDMLLMSKCNHNICANSSFSMWGARLNENENKIMIRPLKDNNEVVVDREKMSDYWRRWILIDEIGK